MLSQGWTAKQIALVTERSHRTIENRIRNLREKHGAENSIHLVTLVLKKRLQDILGMLG